VAAAGGHHGIALVRAETLILAELSLLVAVALFFSSFSSPYLSTMLTGGLWVIGRNTPELEALARTRLSGRPEGEVIELLVLALPDFHAFYVSGADLGAEGIVSIHESFVSWSYVAQVCAYSAAYSALCLLAAVILFGRRDLT
jgi:ABC-type transport system involved in multi-copper enzyme maturation permease subunit